MLVEERVSEFERAMMQLVYQSRQTEISIFQLSEEMRNFKDEMLAFKDEMTASKNEMNRKWGDLVRKMGTFVEDIVLPGPPLLLKKSFNLDVDDMSIPKGFRLWLSAKYRRGARLRRYRWRCVSLTLCSWDNRLSKTASEGWTNISPTRLFVY